MGEETYSISPAVETEWTSIQSLYNHGWISTSSAGVEQCSNMEVIWYVSKLTLFCLFFYCTVHTVPAISYINKRKELNIYITYCSKGNACTLLHSHYVTQLRSEILDLVKTL